VEYIGKMIRTHSAKASNGDAEFGSCHVETVEVEFLRMYGRSSNIEINLSGCTFAVMNVVIQNQKLIANLVGVR
jgi:hypothetical protein